MNTIAAMVTYTTFIFLNFFSTQIF